MSPPSTAAQPPAPPADDLTRGREILIEPLVRGRRVLELWPAIAPGDLPVAAAAAVEWSILTPEASPLPLAPESIDVVLALGAPLLGTGGWAGAPAEACREWLDELQRVLAPDGLLILAAGPAGDPESPLDGELRARFPSLSEVAEVPFLGFSFAVSGTDELAIAGDLAALDRSPHTRLLVCGRGDQPAVRDSVLVALPFSGAPPAAAPPAVPGAGGGREIRRLTSDLAARTAELRMRTAECDDLREALLLLQDEKDRSDEALGNLRRETERLLLRASRSDDAAELANLERERAERRALAAERSLAEAEVALRRRTMELAAFARELRRRLRPPEAPPAAATPNADPHGRS